MDTVARLRERLRPILVFIWDEDPVQWPFLRELLQELPKNKTLALALDDACAPMPLERYHIPDTWQFQERAQTRRCLIVAGWFHPADRIQPRDG